MCMAIPPKATPPFHESQAILLVVCRFYFDGIRNRDVCGRKDGRTRDMGQQQQQRQEQRIALQCNNNNFEVQRRL
eukprot:scaffold2319_cov107-Cylindrotheca_fusiformis.AAC.2